MICIIISLLFYSCNKNNKETELFEDKITLLENNPELILSQLDTCNVEKITNEEEATDFLLQSLARNYINKTYYPPKEKVLKSISIFKNRNKVQQQLEGLYLLAKIYKKEKDLNSEIATIEKAILLAKQEEDSEWIFYLYSYLGDMHIREHNILKFIKYQTLANQSIKDIDIQKMSVYARIQIAKSRLYIGQYSEASDLLNPMEEIIGKQHMCYSDYKRLQGIISFKQEKWDNCIEQMKESLEKEKIQNNKFTCYSILTYCYYHIGDLQQASFYQELTISNDIEGETDYAEIEFYKLCAKFAKEDQHTERQIKNLIKVIERYEDVVKKLNNLPLGEAIQSYTNFYEKNQHERQIMKYRYCIAGLSFMLCIGTIVYMNKKRKQAYKYLFLQQQINALEGLKTVKEETKNFVLRDFEIAKRIAMLKYTQKEQNLRFLKELDKLSLINENYLLTTQWDKFYHHINLSFNNFHSALTKKYPILNEKEIQLCCLLIAGFKTEEIAAIWTKSVFSVHKYKTNIRKKMNVPEGGDIVIFLTSNLTLQ